MNSCAIIYQKEVFPVLGRLVHKRRSKYVILDYVPELNQIELDIYNYISHNLDLVALMTIRELAEDYTC